MSVLMQLCFSILNEQFGTHVVPPFASETKLLKNQCDAKLRNYTPRRTRRDACDKVQMEMKQHWSCIDHGQQFVDFEPDSHESGKISSYRLTSIRQELCESLSQAESYKHDLVITIIFTIVFIVTMMKNPAWLKHRVLASEGGRRIEHEVVCGRSV
jgi:hypothetical protein